MTNAQPQEIRITNMSYIEGYIKYELEIVDGSDLLIYHARYSELRNLFYKFHNADNFFPSKQFTVTFLKPLLPKRRLEEAINARFTDFQLFFERLNKAKCLHGSQSFIELVARAKRFEAEVQEPPKGKCLSFSKNNEEVQKNLYVIV